MIVIYVEAPRIIPRNRFRANPAGTVLANPDTSQVGLGYAILVSGLMPAFGMMLGPSGLARIASTRVVLVGTWLSVSRVIREEPKQLLLALGFSLVPSVTS